MAVLARARAFADFSVSDAEPEVVAVRALRARGVDSGEQLLQNCSAEAILAACRDFDRRNEKGDTRGAGWLYTVVRNGGLRERREPEDTRSTNERKAAERISRFNDYARRFPVGAVAEVHGRLEQRRYPSLPVEQRCPGLLVVIAAGYPTIAVRCDKCAFEAAYPLRALPQLPDEPLAVGLAEPEPHQPQPIQTPVTSQRAHGLRRHPRTPNLPQPQTQETTHVSSNG